MADIGIAPKLTKLLPLLGSDKDGEVLATVSAIGRLLSTAHLDWHDLAALIEHGYATPARPQTNGPRWQDMAKDLLARGSFVLRDAERDFLESMAHWPTAPSDKQTEWLQSISDRVQAWGDA